MPTGTSAQLARAVYKARLAQPELPELLALLEQMEPTAPMEQPELLGLPALREPMEQTELTARLVRRELPERLVQPRRSWTETWVIRTQLKEQEPFRVLMAHLVGSTIRRTVIRR